MDHPTLIYSIDNNDHVPIACIWAGFAAKKGNECNEAYAQPLAASRKR